MSLHGKPGIGTTRWVGGVAVVMMVTAVLWHGGSSLARAHAATPAAEALGAQADDPAIERWTSLLEQLGKDGVTYDQRKKIYDQLADAGDARLIPALHAYIYGLLAQRDGRLVIFGSREDAPGGGQGYPLTDAFTGKPVTDATGKQVFADGMSHGMISAPRRDRRQLAKMVSALTLLDPDPAKRRDAIVRAGERAEEAQLPTLRKLLKQSPTGENAVVLREAIARIQLAHGAAGDKLTAARELGDIASSVAGASLQSALPDAKSGGDAELIAAIEYAQSRVDAHQRLIRWAQYTFAGVSTGSILILMGLGLTIVFGLMGVINMAHGEFMMIGAMTTYVVCQAFMSWLPGGFDWYPLAAVPASFMVAGGIGWVCEFTVIRRLYGRPLDSLLATVGMSFLLIQCARVIFGDTLAVTPPSWLVGAWRVGHDFSLPLNRLYIIGVCLVCVGLTYFIIRRTPLGLLLRATTQDRATASTLGVSTRLIDGLTFAFGSGLAGLAGSAVVMYDKINPEMGQSYVVQSFLVVVIGGVGNLAGVIVAGLGLGFVNKYLEPMFGSPPLSTVFGATGSAVYAKIAVLVLVIVLLQWRPRGLFPAKGRLADA